MTLVSTEGHLLRPVDMTDLSHIAPKNPIVRSGSCRLPATQVLASPTTISL